MSYKNKAGKKAKRGPWPRLQKFWDVRAACNFIGGGAGSGLLMIAAIISLMGLPSNEMIITGVISISIGLLCVFFEIGRPWRSLNMFFNPRTSWMTREGIVVVPLVICAGLAFIYTGQPISKMATLMMGLLAVAFLYCQVRMLAAAKGIPAWNHPSLMPYVFCSGLTEALGLAICFPGFQGMPGLWLALLIMILLRLALWITYTRHLHRDRAPEATCRVFDRIYPYVLAGHLLPLVLLLASWYGFTLIFSIIAGLLAAATGWYIKVIIITRAAQTRGFAIPRTPVRGQGQSHVLGR
jgi:phenylacetyl-CoA:acceptor oxidoreductase subunit 2